MTDDKAVRYAAICQPRSRKEQTASKYTWMYTLQDLKDLSLRKNTSLLLRTHSVYNGPTGLQDFLQLPDGVHEGEAALVDLHH